MKVTNDPFFDWLCITIGLDHNYFRKDYTKLVRALHDTEFRPRLPMDANRGADGLQLRVDFIAEHGPWGSSVNRGPCTFLELLVGLSKRMSFLMYQEKRRYYTCMFFWKLIDNLGLAKCTDDRWDSMNGMFFVEDAAYRINERAYDTDGSGGLFPLKNPHGNQRTVEIWYQMNAWLIENSDVGEFE